jgi:hypothetical protein
VLVLPFDNLSIEKGGPPYEDIASAELTSGLARRNPGRLSVIDPMTARKLKNTKECVIKIGNQLGADYVLLGDVEQSNVVQSLYKPSGLGDRTDDSSNSSFSKAWPGMTNSIASVLEVGDVTKE